jgi:hypothetical protein
MVLLGVISTAALVGLIGLKTYAPSTASDAQEFSLRTGMQGSARLSLEVFNEYTQHKPIVWAVEFWPYLAEPYRDTSLVASTSNAADMESDLEYEWIVDGAKISDAGPTVTHVFRSVGYHEVRALPCISAIL